MIINLPTVDQLANPLDIDGDWPTFACNIVLTCWQCIKPRKAFQECSKLHVAKAFHADALSNSFQCCRKTATSSGVVTVGVGPMSNLGFKILSLSSDLDVELTIIHIYRHHCYLDDIWIELKIRKHYLIRSNLYCPCLLLLYIYIFTTLSQFLRLIVKQQDATDKILSRKEAALTWNN